jgi:chromosome partitioning protein
LTLPSIIAIGSQKGGVGKTTTSISLGASLAEMDQKVLLIDLDPQAHLTFALGLDPERLHSMILQVILGNVPLVDVVHETDIPSLDLVPAGEGLAVLERRLYDRPEYEYLLKRSLEPVESGPYDVIIIDSPPSVGTLMLNALTAAELLVIPTQCEYYAVRSMRRVLQLVRLVREKTNPGLAYRVLVTMFDKQSRLSSVLREQLIAWLEGGLLETVIELDPKIRESAAVRQPVTQYAPQSFGTLQYRQLARELMDYE